MEIRAHAQSQAAAHEYEQSPHLLSNGKRYEVPPHRHDYWWGEEQWEDLWLDLVALENGDQQHYMGALVRQEYAPDQYRIIDGRPVR